jgi:hypothetical protein
MEFWAQFMEDKPDLIKLYEIGQKLFPLKQSVDSSWRQLARTQGDHSLRVLRLYARYQTDILNDKRLGAELM